MTEVAWVPDDVRIRRCPVCKHRCPKCCEHQDDPCPEPERGTDK